jgi:hypothetical protein
MEQHAINRAIARVTREPVGLIANLGFSLLAPSPASFFHPQRRMYPLRLARSSRKHHPRRPPKKTVPVKPIVTSSGKAS